MSGSVEPSADYDAPAWTAHLAYSLGFVARSDEEAREVLSLWPDEDAIDADSQPREIVVVRGSARPKPQFDGDEFPRLPGSWMSCDYIRITDDFDGVDDAETALLLWEAALGAAERLNRVLPPEATHS